MLQDAKDEYGDAKVHFDVTTTEADESDISHMQGFVKGAVNVVVTNDTFTTQTGGARVSQGYAFAVINMDRAGKRTLAHELAHHFSGDTTGWVSQAVTWLGKQQDKDLPTLGGIALAPFNAAADMRNDTERLGLRLTGISGFNRGAREFQKMITPTQK